MELRTPSNNVGNPTTYPKPDPESLHEDDKTQHQTHEAHVTSSFFDDIDSNCSTPYVSAPSSPGRGSGNGGFYYSAPASPMHFVLTSSYAVMSPDNNSGGGGGGGGLGFEFGSGSSATGSWMSSADELFLNGKIRPMKLSTHLEKPQVLAPLLDLENEEEEENEELVSRGRDLRVSRDKSVRRRTRSLSPLRNTFSKWNHKEEVEEEDNEKQKQKQQHKSAFSSSLEVGMKPNKEIHEAEAEAASLSASSSRSSSVGGSRSTSKRWVFLKDFLRSKSEGRSNNKYFWLPTKEKKQATNTNTTTTRSSSKEKDQSISASSISTSTSSVKKNKPVNGVLTGKKRRVPPPSPHELHYTANRAQAEEMKKKTFLPYKQGLLGCLGFTSKGYGAMNGFARALNPVSSR